MTNGELKLGDTVMLSSSSPWVIFSFAKDQDRLNPINTKGSVSLPEHPGWVTVCWENGQKNYYMDQHRDLIKVV